MSSMYFTHMAMQIPVGLRGLPGSQITVSVGMFPPERIDTFRLRSVVFLASCRPFLGRAWRRDSFCMHNENTVPVVPDREFATFAATTFIGNAGGIFSQGPLAFLLTIVSWRSSFIAIGIATLGISSMLQVDSKSSAGYGLPAVERTRDAP